MPELPDTFSRFRRLVEKRLQPRYRCRRRLPPAGATGGAFSPYPTRCAVPASACPCAVAARPAQRRLQQFVEHGDGIRRYKDTRNCLDPLDGSSTLSPWLANGNLSAREVARADTRARGTHGSQRVDLLAVLRAAVARVLLLARAPRRRRPVPPGGRGGRAVHRCTFEPRNFARWCAGDTDYPLVNALHAPACRHRLDEQPRAADRRQLPGTRHTASTGATVPHSSRNT
jgi:deoxyribodipyrimidine photo-lyase